MKKIVSVAICFCIVLSFPLLAIGQTITVIYDNNPFQEGLEPSFGFSCVIQGTEKSILFDTGSLGSVLLANMEKLKIYPQDIDVVVLSHIDSDHVGGLPDFLRANPNVTVYLLNSFTEFFKNTVKQSGADIVEVQKSLKICDDVYSSGELGVGKKEQAVILHTDKGMIVITGCAHPGIVPIVQNAKELLHDNVLLVMGGFHLASHRPTVEQVVAELKQLEVRYVGPGHCSGDIARQVFTEAYQSNYVSVGVGTTITIKYLP